MSASHRDKPTAFGSAVENLRQLFEQALSADDVADPQLFDQLSQSAAEIAQLVRAKRSQRNERVATIVTKVSEFFPELAERAAAGVARLEEEGVGRAEVALQAAAQANQALAESESGARIALEGHNYDDLQEHASRARGFQAAVVTQRDILASLLAPLSDAGLGADSDISTGLAQPSQLASDGDESTPADLDRDSDETPPVGATASGQTGLSHEPDRTLAPTPEPDHAQKLEYKAVADTFVATPLPENVAGVIFPEKEPRVTEPDRSHAQRPGRPEPRTEPLLPQIETVNAAFWSALAQGRAGLAQGLLEVGALGNERHLLGPVIELAAMALVADGTGEVVDAARETAEDALAAWQTEDTSEQVSPETALAAALILLPASILLALIEPGSNQAGLLSALPNYRAAPADWEPARRLPELCAMARKTADAISAISGQFHPEQEVFVNLISHEEWTEELRRHCESMKSWIDGQLARSIRYSAATDVWHAMIRPGGVLGQLFAIAVEDRAPDGVRRAISDFKTLSLIREVETDVRGRVAARRRPIEGPAQRELENLVQQALQLLRSWVEMRARVPTAAAMSRAQPVAELRAALDDGLVKTGGELQTLAGVPASGLGVANMIMIRLGTLLNGQQPSREGETADELLGRDVFPLPQIKFDLNWHRTRPLPRHLAEELVGLCEAKFDPLAAGRERLSHSDFIGAELALALVGKWQDHDESEAERLRREIRKAAGDAKEAALARLTAVRHDIEEAERSGRIEVGKSQELAERIESLRSRLERAEPVELAAFLEDAGAEERSAIYALNQSSRAVRERIQLRLTKLGRPASEQEQTRIEAFLDSGQFAIAEDLVERLEAGETLPDPSPAIPPAEERFDRFFPKRAAELATWLRPGRLVQLAEDSTRGSDGLLGEGAQALPDDLSAVVKAWLSSTETKGNLLQGYLVDLLAGFGFTDPEITFSPPPKNASEALFRMHVRPLRDRDTAVLPEYGSIVGGSYALLCLWRKRDAEDIAQALSRHPVVGSATIVLFFGVLDVEQRRRLAALTRADRLRSALVIDDVLMLHLASQGKARLPTLFACALPFTDSRPWADTGQPPPEMFFGRQREMSAVEARSGEFTHLLYGGRQLGKTALLRQVARAASGESIARYISIAQIGMTQPPEDLWNVLASELSGAIPGLAGVGTAARFRSQILEWLDSNPSRRILLLLDEADNFFIKDREQRFAVTEMLRTLSVERDRRFKPVFAGLRNVQKLARDPNSPLAHLGQPMVIGPLLRGSERAEAEALVRWPFGALGYRMDQLVVTRIVTFANYYPSLIQVVCQRLLRNLRQRHGDMGPPWTVRIEDVEKVLETRELKDAAFERFRITLELDQRYNLLTRLIAYLSIDDPRLLAEGIDVLNLRDLAADSWPAGFPADLGSDAFDAILDEMEGLGLLRQVDGTHYALRSANLAHLIGTQSAIAQQVEGFRRQPAPREHDPLEFRRQVKGNASILTARQESELFAPISGVLVLAGVALAEIGEWRNAVSSAIDFARKHDLTAERQVLNRSVTIDTYLAELKKFSKGKDSQFIVIVPPDVAWTAEWIDATLRALSTVPAARRIRVIFIANAARAWAWVAEPARREFLLSGSALPVKELSVGPWSRESLNLWLELQDQYGRFPDRLIADQAAPLLEATGGWVTMIKRLAAMGQRDQLTNTEPAALAAQLQSPDGQTDLLADIAEIPELIAVLGALTEAEELRRTDERVDGSLVKEAAAGIDGDLVERTLVWCELVGLISRGDHGLVLNPLVKAALPRIREG